MTCKIIICKIGEAPKAETVENVFRFCKEITNDGHLTERVLRNGPVVVVLLADEEAELKNLEFNRFVPDTGRELPKGDFVVDMRTGPPEAYAKPGEPGYFALRGNFIITKYDGRGGYEDLSDEDIKALLPRLAAYQCRRCKENNVAYQGAIFCGAGCAAAWEMKI